MNSRTAMKLHEETTPRAEHSLPGLARRAVEFYVRERRVIEPLPMPASALLVQRAACFVTLKTIAGDLRGCIGMVEPAEATLAGEIIANAMCRDPRPPILARH